MAVFRNVFGRQNAVIKMCTTHAIAYVYLIRSLQNLH